MVSEALRSFPEKRAVIRLFHRRSWILAGARSFKRISAPLDLAFDVSCLAARSTQIFESIIMRLKLVIADAPILNGKLGIDKALAVTLLKVCLVDEVGRLKSIGLAIPMHQRAAHAGSGQKSYPSTHRQCRLVGRIANGHRLLDVILHQAFSDREPQFVVNCRRLEIRYRISRRTAFDADDLQ